MNIRDSMNYQLNDNSEEKMKILYGIEPDVCMSHPEVVSSDKDIILPKYFYNQLEYIKQSSVEFANDAAAKIIDSLLGQGELNFLVFKTIRHGTVYFVDEGNNLENYAKEKNIDIKTPIDRYLLILLKIAEITEAKIVFIAMSAQVISRCSSLGFEVASIEEFSNPGNSWLQPEMLVDIQTKLDPLALIKWQEDLEEVVEPENNIHWLDITR